MSTEFSQVFDEIQNNPHINAVVLISSKPDCFIAGADIRYAMEFGGDAVLIGIILLAYSHMCMRIFWIRDETSFLW